MERGYWLIAIFGRSDIEHVQDWVSKGEGPK